MKCGYVGLIGTPNAGKSTLLNLLVNEKLAIVSPKPQTTRRRVLGIVNEPDQFQMIFVDAPGVIRGHEGLNRFLEKEWQEVLQDSDMVIAVLNMDAPKKRTLIGILDLIEKSKKPFVAVVTKTDIDQLAPRRWILEEELRNRGIPFLSVSLRDKEKQKKSGIKAWEEFRQQLFQLCLPLLPESQRPLFEDEDIFTPHTTREIVTEYIRESCFHMLKQELPYNVAVRLVKFEESPKIKIYADIIVAKESQKPIVIGRAGSVLGEIGTLAREQIEKLLGQKVFLKLQVVVREEWFFNKGIMRELGYQLPDNEEKSSENKKAPRQRN